MDQEVLLTYNGVVLTKRDMNLLRGQHYLNDCIIHFYFSYLTSLCDNDILLVSPTLSFWLTNSQNCEADFRDFEESNRFSEKQVVIFTVNDNQNMSQNDGGKHWSLLMYYRRSNAFVHYDSLGGLNTSVAKKLYKAIKKCMATRTSSLATNISSTTGHKSYYKFLHQCANLYPIKNIIRAICVMNNMITLMVRMVLMIIGFKDMCYTMQNYNDDEDDTDDANDLWFGEETVMSQQKNLYDCGLYVMSVARVICGWYYKRKKADQQQQDSIMENHLFPNIIAHVDNSIEHIMRSELLRFIESLIERNSN